jgi:hypothetical protein
MAAHVRVRSAAIRGRIASVGIVGVPAAGAVGAVGLTTIGHDQQTAAHVDALHSLLTGVLDIEFRNAGIGAW